MKVIVDSSARFPSASRLCREVGELAKKVKVYGNICIHEKNAAVTSGFSLLHFRNELYLPRDFPTDPHNLHLPKEYVLRRELAHFNRRTYFATILVKVLLPIFAAALMLACMFLGITVMSMISVIATSVAFACSCFTLKKTLLVLALKTLRDLWNGSTDSLLSFGHKICSFISETEMHKKALKPLSLKKKIEVAHCFASEKERLHRLLPKHPWWSVKGLRVRWDICKTNELLRATEESLEKLSRLSRFLAKTYYSRQIGFLSTGKISALWESWYYLFLSKKIICQKPLSHYCSRHSG